MIERFAGTQIDTSGRVEVDRKLGENRGALRQAEADIAALEEELADLPRLTDAVATYEASDLADRLTEQQRMNLDNATFIEGTNRINLLQEAVTEFVGKGLPAQLMQGYESIEGSSHEAELNTVATATHNLGLTVETVLTTDVSLAIASAHEQIRVANEAWMLATEQQRIKHAETVRTLRAEGHDPERYLATTKALGDLKAKEPRLGILRKRVAALNTERTTLLGELDGHERQV
jgi:hypothetical protein